MADFGGWGNLITSLNNAVASPTFLSGAAMVNAGAEGKNIGAGFLAGGEAATAASKNQYALQEARRKMEQMQLQDQYLKGFDAKDPKWAGIDPRLIEMAQRTNSIGFLEEAAKAKIQADRQSYMHPLDQAAKRAHIEQVNAQLQQIKMQTPEWRAANAERFGLVKGTPEHQAFVITGTYTPKGDGLVHLKDGETVWQKNLAPGGGFRLDQLAGNEKTPSGYKATPDGNLKAIPGGPADIKINEKRQQDYAQTTALIQQLDELAKSVNSVKAAPGLAANFGLYGMVPNRPGSNAGNAQTLLETLRTQGAFSVLQEMRNASKTGGALGAVSDSEQKMLQGAIAPLGKMQDYDQALESLQKILDHIEASKQRIRDAYNDHWNRDGQSARQPMQAPSSSPAPGSRLRFDPTTGALVPVGGQ